ncbi:hypothetical protein B0H12DRAFT_207545 [Mycena haematopus]|nr:hypothetical protein B0H12DRAFT_207545 [Mycena haematopus]
MRLKHHTCQFRVGVEMASPRPDLRRGWQRGGRDNEERRGDGKAGGRGRRWERVRRRPCGRGCVRGQGGMWEGRDTPPFKTRYLQQSSCARTVPASLTPPLLASAAKYDLDATRHDARRRSYADPARFSPRRVLLAARRLARTLFAPASKLHRLHLDAGGWLRLSSARKMMITGFRPSRQRKGREKGQKRDGGGGGSMMRREEGPEDACAATRRVESGTMTNYED